MSLGIIIKAPEGLVLAAESRVTLSTPTGVGNEHLSVNFDNATKLLNFHSPNDNIGAVTYGLAAIGVRTAHSFIPEFESTLGDERLTVEAFAKSLSDFFSNQWNAANLPAATAYNGQDMTFNVAGFDDGEPYGKIFSFNIPRTPIPVEVNRGNTNFGITWGGQREIVDRLIFGYDSRLIQILTAAGCNMQQIMPLLGQLQLSMPIQFMPLQDCINLALLFIKTTIDAQGLTVGIRGCGGAIDLAIITRGKNLKFIQRKDLLGE